MIDDDPTTWRDVRVALLMIGGLVLAGAAVVFMSWPIALFFVEIIRSYWGI